MYSRVNCCTAQSLPALYIFSLLSVEAWKDCEILNNYYEIKHSSLFLFFVVLCENGSPTAPRGSGEIFN